MALSNFANTIFPVPVTDSPTALPGGTRFRNDVNGNVWEEILLYVPSALQGNLTVGAPYYISFSGIDSQNPQAVALAGSATSGVVRLMGVLMSNQQNTGATPTSGTYSWFAIRGTVSVLVDGTTDVAAGDYLRVNSTVVSGALIKDPASGTTAPSTVSVGVAQAAQAANSAVLIQVYLLGDRALLA